MVKKTETVGAQDSPFGKDHAELEQTWIKRFRAASDSQKDNAGSWDRNRRLLYGCLGKNPSNFDIAIGWGLSQFLISQIYYQNPQVLVRARTREAREIAKLLTDVCQYDADEMDLKEVGNLALVDCFVYGYGAVIEDYHNEIADITEKEDGASDYKEIAEQYFMFRRLPPPDFLKDPAGIKLDLSDSKYIFVGYYPTISELKDNKERYCWLPDDIANSKSASPIKVPIGPAEPGDQSTGGSRGKEKEEDPDYKQIRVYEIWDKVAKKVYDFAADKKKLIGMRPEPDAPDPALQGWDGWPFRLNRAGKNLFPVTIHALLPQGETWYPKPVLDLISPQLENITKINKMFVTDACTKWRKFATIEGFVDLAKAADILQQQDGIGIIEVSKDSLDEMATGQVHQYPNVGELIAPLKDISVNDKDYITSFEVLMNQIQQILGFADTARGGLPKTRSSREAVMITEKQNRRTSKLADQVVTFHRQVIEKHIQILQQCGEASRYVKVVDNNGLFKQFEEYTKDDIQGTFFFDALVGSSMPKDTESAKQSYIQFIQMFVPFLQKEGYSIAPIVYEAAELFQIKNVDDFFRNQKEAAKMVAAILYAVKEGKKVPPNAMIESTSKLVSSVLTQEEVASVGAMVRGGGDEGDGGGSAPTGQRGESNASKAGMS